MLQFNDILPFKVEVQRFCLLAGLAWVQQAVQHFSKPGATRSSRSSLSVGDDPCRSHAPRAVANFFKLDSETWLDATPTHVPVTRGC
jgi:hypothetical protein